MSDNRFVGVDISGVADGHVLYKQGDRVASMSIVDLAALVRAQTPLLDRIIVSEDYDVTGEEDRIGIDSTEIITITLPTPTLDMLGKPRITIFIVGSDPACGADVVVESGGIFGGNATATTIELRTPMDSLETCAEVREDGVTLVWAVI